jgi:hypothetical protein
MRSFVLACVFMLVASFASAQVVSSSRLGWDQPNATAAEASSYTYKYYPDGATTGTVLTGITCSGTTTVACSAVFPAFTPGAHTLTISATNSAGEGPKSAAFNFTFVVLPSAPVSLRVQ